MAEAARISVAPASAGRWADFEKLMGKRGGAGGCWCMLWRLSHADFEAGKGAANRKAIKAIFESGTPPGLIAYDGGEPVGWCSIAPRTELPRLKSTRVLKPIDDQPVWSVTCFLIKRSHRRRGVSVALLRAAEDFVRRQGGTIIEGYPIEPAKSAYPDTFAWTGLASAFRKAGFEEKARRSETRPIMRRTL
jgi:GNAT superfamily N-acetyltransferase|tara:strand:+ start:2110 stop:2682 length:573 start_codon:yes stop_codon:yes gene_type:complete